MISFFCQFLFSNSVQGIVREKLDQLRRCFEVQFAAGRDLRPGQLGNITFNLHPRSPSSTPNQPTLGQPPLFLLHRHNQIFFSVVSLRFFIKKTTQTDLFNPHQQPIPLPLAAAAPSSPEIQPFS
ncbi:hypothetical protein NC653_000623 [Populus alba x Populus x berolinensis]|uniref:Uncharacterized protein n=1 Tax=Populus alba x Populus x berolinensis TaxID=444605 RepID=A0AAD6WEN0_9ROSI|nr:hypothetical protein NC653_000623 [Populus alba x Populus x berolinensis]